MQSPTGKLIEEAVLYCHEPPAHDKQYTVRLMEIVSLAMTRSGAAASISDYEVWAEWGRRNAVAQKQLKWQGRDFGIARLRFADCARKKLIRGYVRAEDVEPLAWLAADCGL